MSDTLNEYQRRAARTQYNWLVSQAYKYKNLDEMADALQASKWTLSRLLGLRSNVDRVPNFYEDDMIMSTAEFRELVGWDKVFGHKG